MPTSLSLRRLLAALSVLLLLGSVASCGSNDDSADLPDAAGAASDDAGADSDSDDEADATGELSREDAALKFAQCMREHGVDMPDPEPGGGIRLNGNGLSEGQLEAAEKACQKWMDMVMPEDGELPEISEEDKQAMLDLAACMRDKGYDFPDPQFEGGRVTQRVEGDGGSGPGPDDEQFQADHEECATEVGMDLGGFGSNEEKS
jgi:predicted small lipoprotein YifL